MEEVWLFQEWELRKKGPNTVSNLKTERDNLTVHTVKRNALRLGARRGPVEGEEQRDNRMVSKIVVLTFHYCHKVPKTVNL